MKTEEKKAGHTPGPWHWERVKIGDTVQCFLKGQPNEWNDRLVTAQREDLAAFPYSATSPNARLIAAAPDLLEALRGFMLLDWSRPQDAVEANKMLAARAEAAIAKAEGE